MRNKFLYFLLRSVIRLLGFRFQSRHYIGGERRWKYDIYTHPWGIETHFSIPLEWNEVHNAGV